MPICLGRKNGSAVLALLKEEEDFASESKSWITVTDSAVLAVIILQSLVCQGGFLRINIRQ
jgi:hypothetical protein